jgi:ankyrin repeat protein
METTLLPRKAAQLDAELKVSYKRDDKTTLHMAITIADMGTDQISLRHGPNVSHQNKMGYSRLTQAACFDRGDFLKLLLEHAD